MEILEPQQFLASGLFREKDFRAAVRTFDWAQYRGKPVLIQGCASLLPIWAYMALLAELVPYAKSVSYGELKSPIPVLGKLGQE
jgi:hypothetical protein